MTIVSILSDHLLPNFLFIKEMEGRYSDLLFVSTPQMKERHMGEHLEEALGLPLGSVRRIIVPNDNYSDIRSKLEAELPPASSEEYLVNLTGGTKMMALAVQHFFATRHANFVYLPIGSNTYYDFATDHTEPIRYRITLREYFTLYGLTYECDNSLSLVSEPQQPYELFNQLRDNRFYLTSELKDADMQQCPEMRRYLSGGWFEEYTYLRIQKQYNLGEEEIAKSLKIYRSSATTDRNNDNELDVAFVLDNTLYVIECKVSMIGYGRTQKAVVEEYLYKLAAVCKDLGMHVRPYIFTLHQMWQIPQGTLDNIKKRMSILGICRILDGKALSKDKLEL